KGVQSLKNGDLFEAAGFFNAVLASEPDHIKALNNLAVIYYEMDMSDKAKSILEKILAIDPDNDIARENLANLN
ncbi:MAG: methyltransferase, partial [Deltaproteobacteria bacterium]